METSVGIFKVEDAFNITGRGLVLIGQLLHGEVSSGNLLVFEETIRWRISDVNAVNQTNHHDLVGLMVETPITLRQGLLSGSIIGATALIFAQ